MNKTTLGYIKTQTRLPASLGLCPDDPRLVQWLNESVQRLIGKGLWIGTVGRFRICATDGCLSMPPQVASLERVAVCGKVIPIHDYFYEFLENGLGPRSALCNGGASGGSCCGGGGCGVEEANLRGWFPTFADVRGASKKLRLICDLSADVGKRVLVTGYDENNNWIRTAPGGIWQDGETVLLAQSPGTDTTHFFDGGITGIQFLDNREGQVWLYERDTVASTSRLIGSYQYWEENPSYARYFFPSILSQAQTGGGCNTTTVEAIAKMEFIPIVKDTDVLLLHNIPALKEMCSGIKKAEDEADSARSNAIILSAEAIAMRYLDDELDHYLGVGRETGVNFAGSSVGAVHPVMNFL